MARKISVIIPLYNDSEHIARCLESVCGQTISDILEIVIVDDGSSDGSVAVAKEVLERHSMLPQTNIICLEKNQGVAHAREVGAKAATGDYVLYCDSDDYMDPEMCEKLLSKAEADSCDLVVCDYKSIRGKKVEPVRDCYKENFLQQLILCTVTGALWNKLIKTSLLRRPDFRFPVRDFSEDYVYCLQFAIYAEKIGYVPEPLYNYVHRDNSVVLSSSPEKRQKRYDDDMQNFRLDLEILEHEGLLEKYREEIIAHKLKMKNSNNGNLKLWRKTFPELSYEVFTSRYVSIRSRMAYFVRLIGLYKNLK